MSSEAGRKVEEMMAQLRKERDELRVRAHLLKAEMRDEWHAAEQKWEQVEFKLGRAGREARDAAGDLGAAAEQLGEEIANAYRRIRDALR